MLRRTAIGQQQISNKHISLSLSLSFILQMTHIKPFSCVSHTYYIYRSHRMENNNSKKHKFKQQLSREYMRYMYIVHAHTMYDHLHDHTAHMH